MTWASFSPSPRFATSCTKYTSSHLSVLDLTKMRLSCLFIVLSHAQAFTSRSLESRSRVPMINAGLRASFFSSSATSSSPMTPLSQLKEDDTFIPPNPVDFEISDPDCISGASKMRRILVPVSESINPRKEVGISYIHWPAEGGSRVSTPLLLVHGFDSSSLEYRRLGPALASLGIDTYAVDLLGWGYTEYPPASSSKPSLDYSANAKIEALKSFWATLGNDSPLSICGASLGGASAIEFAASEDTPATSLILLDAQGFVDGVGPVVSILPSFIARAGVSVLKSVPLRSSANQMSYFDKETFATEDALKIGRMHCLREGWEEGLMNFMSTGGFRPSEKVKDCTVPTCVIWGREDNILDGDQFANQFMETLPNKEQNQLNWVEECGHVPHLEQPQKTAQIIFDFLKAKEINAKADQSNSDADSKPLDAKVVGIAGAVAAAAAAASYVVLN